MIKSNLKIFLINIPAILLTIKRARLKQLFFLIMFAIPTYAQTTYYVSTSGSDAYNGTSITTPWKTLGKVNTHATFVAGDSILFKCGDVFEGQIQVVMTGSAEHPAVISSYGAGNKPIIYGDLRGRIWTPIAGYAGYYKAYIEPGSFLAQKCFQYYNGAWQQFSGVSRRNAFPSEWAAYYASLGEGQTGISVDSDTALVHTFGSLPMPMTKDSIRIYRYDNAINTGSYYYIVRNLDIRNIVGGMTGGGYKGIFRKLHTQDIINCAVSMADANQGLIDSCAVDSTGDTPIYLVRDDTCIVRYNLVTNVLKNIDGVDAKGVDMCGIGVLDNYTTYGTDGGYNTVEYNTLYNIYDGFTDFYYCNGDTVRYNTGHGASCAGSPDGLTFVFTHNNFTMFPAGGNGSNLGQLGNATLTYTYNTLDSIKDYGIQVMSNGTGGTININHNTIKTITNGNYVNYSTSISGLNSVNNYFYGSGRWMINGSTFYTTLAAFQAATGFEAGSAYYSPTSVNSESSRPTKTELGQNYPNPFNPSTVINYQLSVAGKVRLSVYDILGREITILVDGEKEAGNYSAKFDGSKLSSGVYFTQFIFDSENGKQIMQVKKILLEK